MVEGVEQFGAGVDFLPPKRRDTLDFCGESGALGHPDGGKIKRRGGGSTRSENRHIEIT